MDKRWFVIPILLVMFSFTILEVNAQNSPSITSKEAEETAYDNGFDYGKKFGERYCWHVGVVDAVSEKDPRHIEVADSFAKNSKELNPYPITQKVQHDAWQDGVFTGCSVEYNDGYSLYLKNDAFFDGPSYDFCENEGIKDGLSGRNLQHYVIIDKYMTQVRADVDLSDKPEVYVKEYLVAVEDRCIELYNVSYNEAKSHPAYYEKQLKKDEPDFITDLGKKLVDNKYVEAQVDEAVDDACLIATASYGSPMAKEVQMLREIRDNQLLQTQSGSAFMSGFNTVYYSFAPTIAQWENENPAFKQIVKTTITPLITSLTLLNNVSMDSEAEVLGYGISLILLNVGMYVGVPVAVVVGIRKKFLFSSLC
jgi:hypothetical protein